jgi:hypothetical protein
VWKELSDTVASNLRFIFRDDKAIPPRKASQCRLAIMALYLIALSKAAGYDTWNLREAALWNTVAEWFKWEADHGQSPRWYVFEYGDAERRAQAV